MTGNNCTARPDKISRYINCAGREIHITERGNANAPAIVVWHGLARTGRDFDALAESLCNTWHVICPDMIGRGLSQWAKEAQNEYHLGFYARIAEDLWDALGLRRAVWIGTSMGGMLGMLSASGPLRERISCMVINDVGPAVPSAAAARIAKYAGNPPVFDTLSEFSAWLRQIYAPFGENTERFWEIMTKTSFRRLEDGRVTAHYDPAVSALVTTQRTDLHLWDAYDAITFPVLLLRGETSDVLPPDMAKEMTTRGPRARLVTFTGCGHAPTLANFEQINCIQEFLGASHTAEDR